MKNLNVVFMGTPDFAIDCLEVLNDNYNVICVITQEDKKSGRGKKINMPPVKKRAIELGLDVKQFKSINSDEAKEFLTSLDIDFIVVVAYGQIVKKWLIDLPKYEILNVHASLLPKLRGASPIQTSILQDFNTTGVTIMRIDEGLDSGDMLLKSEVKIYDDMNFENLHNELKLIGSRILLEAMEQIINGKANFIKQDENEKTYAKMIKKEDLVIDFSKNTREVFNKIRAFSPSPLAYTFYNGKRLKIYESKIILNDEKQIILKKLNKKIEDIEDGMVVFCDKNSFYVKCKDGFINILNVHLQDSKRMNSADFLKGHKINIFDKFGS